MAERPCVLSPMAGSAAMPTSSHDAHPIIAKLESILTLSDEEKAAILRLPM